MDRKYHYWVHNIYWYWVKYVIGIKKKFQPERLDSTLHTTVTITSWYMHLIKLNYIFFFCLFMFISRHATTSQIFESVSFDDWLVYMCVCLSFRFIFDKVRRCTMNINSFCVWHALWIYFWRHNVCCKSQLERLAVFQKNFCTIAAISYEGNATRWV